MDPLLLVANELKDIKERLAALENGSPVKEIPVTMCRVDHSLTCPFPHLREDDCCGQCSIADRGWKITGPDETDER